MKTTSTKGPSFFPANGAIIQDRWPRLFDSLVTADEPVEIAYSSDAPQPTLVLNGIHLSSAYDQMAEAELQASLVPDGSRFAWIYGIGVGQVPRVLLRRQGIESMVVVIMNRVVALQSFTYFDQSDWLSDPRVKLVFGADQEDINLPFAAIPSCLQLAGDEASRIRDLVFLELSTPFIQAAFRAKSGEMTQRIKQNFSYIQSDGDVAELFGTRIGETIAVAAAGPTLEYHYQWLRRNKTDLTLIAVDAALKPLLQAGIVPNIVVSIDAHREGVLSLFEGIDHETGRSMTLVYFPVVHKDVLQLWPGKRLTAYSDSPLYESFAGTNSNGTLFTSGSVTHSSIDLAVKMGALNVMLLGADFSFPGGKTHVSESPISREKPAAFSDHWVLNGYGKRVTTSPNLRWYLRDLETYIGRHKHVSFLNGSREGAHIEGTSYLEH